MKFKVSAPRILDFDLENRPLSYLGSDFTTSEVTAIAWGYSDDSVERIRCAMLGKMEPREMLDRFVEAYNASDIVTGHFIRKHDLPIINGALAEYEMPALKPKLTIDTFFDLRKIKGISKSQESLGSMLGLESPKVGMNQTMWRAANRLERLDQVRDRVIGDVRQHMELRVKLTELGWLGPPKMWYGGK